ncbi:ArsR/SmtB family transcription factor [Xenorhabdus bovienii]|uniref:ArsR/SmtB family transcription factor n=1 Tax=Xenorhabdus bovienii TaxID=40576 RepID=UPI0004DA5049|nr:winged helix-turn-helix domain-containing protein [Xenorhabdus bovienii]CDG86636.1 Putative transcriptional regulator [Xenorhabdus bovienii str. feltiae France]CDG91468.1 Putative transcriptional regulator [Xenorhabdus bovienii str. feltiae Florida]
MNELNLEESVATIAAVLADRTRTRMLFLMMDGRAYTATELSAASDVAPSTASVHLNRLAEGKLVICVKQGRHRYFKIHSEEVAALLESMMHFANRNHTDIAIISTPKSLHFFRTCYDHMAGEIAVKIHNSLLTNHWMTRDYKLTQRGNDFLLSIGVCCDTESSSRRKFACSCLDWSERHFHLGGFLGASLFKTFLQKKWAIRQLDSRELILTEQGRRVLMQKFDVDIN